MHSMSRMCAMCIAEQPQICQINWPIHCDKVIMVAKKERLTLCFYNLMKIEMNVNLWSVGHKNTPAHTHTSMAKNAFAILSIVHCKKREQSHLPAWIYLCILMRIWMIPKRMMLFLLCHSKCSANCKKSWICALHVKYRMRKNVPSLALFSGWFHVFGSIFKLNYWISSIWSNMHMYSSLFIVVHAHADFIPVWLWLLYVMYCAIRMAYTEFFRGSVDL